MVDLYTVTLTYTVYEYFINCAFILANKPISQCV